MLSRSIVSRAVRRFGKRFAPPLWRAQMHAGYARALKACAPDVVVAEFGPLGVHVLPACTELGIPLIVHFRGYDATRKEAVQSYLDGYRRLFADAYGIIAVSKSIERELTALGCPKTKIVVDPGGVDVDRFAGATPESNAPHFVGIGRLVEKKGLAFTLRAFARVVREVPTARLRVVGEGPLFQTCQTLARHLQIDDSVDFLGERPNDFVVREIRSARCVVLHSIVASCGDSEGTPHVILEAGAMGVPVVSTRHAGIPEVVIEDVTGLLVDERDIGEMAKQMLAIARDPERAGTLGRSAAAHVRKYYTIEQSLKRLERVIRGAVERESIDVIRSEIAKEFC